MQDIQICLCDRCGFPCKVADTANEEARILKASTEPQGHCLDCEVTCFLKVTSVMRHLITDPKILLWEAAQRQFGEVMRAGNADARPEDINWQRVVDNWDLPFKKARRKRGKK